MTEQPNQIINILAAEDLEKYTFVDASGIKAASDTNALGVCMADTAAGEMCPVAVSGVVIVKSGYLFTSVGQSIMSDDFGNCYPCADALLRRGISLDKSAMGSLMRILLL